MTCGLISAKPLLAQLRNHYQLGSENKTSWKFEWNISFFFWENALEISPEKIDFFQDWIEAGWCIYVSATKNIIGWILICRLFNKNQTKILKSLWVFGLNSTNKKIERLMRLLNQLSIYQSISKSCPEVLGDTSYGFASSWCPIPAHRANGIFRAN